MHLQSKYNINDVVFKITQAPIKTWQSCPSCEGEGRITLANGKQLNVCPDCYGHKGRWQHGAAAWQVGDCITIGEVRVYARNFKKSGMFDNVGSYCVGSDSLKVVYMCYETGIGSGDIHHEETLCSSREAAQAECHRLNAEVTK